MQNDTNNNNPIIEFRNAEITNGDSLVIYGLNMAINSGEFVYLTGRVGSGKTSIIRTMIGENRITDGYARVGEFDLTTIKQKQIPYLRRFLGIVFQDFQLLMDRSIEDNLEFALRATDWHDKVEIKERIEEVLEQVGMASKAHKMPHQLSGGEQQRIAIARSLLNRPAVMLADEPTGNLDRETAIGIMDLIYKINQERKTAVVMVTHNQHLIKQYPGRIFVCSNNKCLEYGTLEDSIDLDLGLE
ncbi:MAG: ATP-binding cassette domain-containing protein [Bacteroidales bacterium]|nr:ATP-binding cassette domain-containing protein [Bacteroidales bacterium]